MHICKLCAVLFFNDTPTPDIYTLSLHDALPICQYHVDVGVLHQRGADLITRRRQDIDRSEEHTSELQSRENLVCRLLLEKKNKSRTSQPSGSTGTSPSCASRRSLSCTAERSYSL